jgi:hypothetical protein
MRNDELRQEFEAWGYKRGLNITRYEIGCYGDPTQQAYAGYKAGYAKGKEQPCPYVVSSDEGTSYCALAEKRTMSAAEFERYEWHLENYGSRYALATIGITVE